VVEKPEFTRQNFTGKFEFVVMCTRIEATAKTAITAGTQVERTRRRSLITVAPIMAKALELPGREAQKIPASWSLYILTQHHDFFKDRPVYFIQILFVSIFLSYKKVHY
jgi:hypothetical protein